MKYSERLRKMVVIEQKGSSYLTANTTVFEGCIAQKKLTELYWRFPRFILLVAEFKKKSAAQAQANVQQFANMVKERKGKQVEQWKDQISQMYNNIFFCF